MTTDNDLRDCLTLYLSANVVSIVFTKANGEDRVMQCTLNPALIKDTYEKKTDRIKKPNEETMSVWDVEKQAWRSFRLDSVKGWSLKHVDA